MLPYRFPGEHGSPLRLFVRKRVAHLPFTICISFSGRTLFAPTVICAETGDTSAFYYLHIAFS